MKTYCIAGTAWVVHRKACVSLVERDLLYSPFRSGSLNIDETTIVREVACNSLEDSGACVKEIDFSQWVNDGIVEGGVVNIDAVRRDAYSMQSEEIVVINSIGFISDIIEKTLVQLRIGLFSQPEWPKAIILVCDNAQRFQAGPALANAFYIRPSVMTKAAIGRQTRTLLLDAKLLRLFGQGIGSAPRFLRRLNYWIFTKREKARAREYGWVWEE